MKLASWYYRGMGSSTPRHANLWLSILCVAFAAGGCGFQKLRDVYTDGVHASSVQTRVLAQHAYQTVWMRPADMAHPRGTDGEQFTLSLPDRRVVALTELTPAVCDAAARSVAGCSIVTAEAGPDNAASAWNDSGPRAARLPLHKPPRLAFRPLGPEARPATDFVVCKLRYEVKRRRRVGRVGWLYPGVVIDEAPPLCEYMFWFDRGQCVQVMVSVSDRPPGLVGFVPALGSRGPNGVRSRALPIREEHLADLYGPVRVKSIFE